MLNCYVVLLTKNILKKLTIKLIIVVLNPNVFQITKYINIYFLSCITKADPVFRTNIEIKCHTKII